jgi:hypothetical protein
MAIGRITGQMLFQNLERQGVDLQFDSNLVYLDVTNRRVGINNISPEYSFDSSGNVKISNIIIQGNTISSNTGRVNLGNISNVVITGGDTEFILFTDGLGNLSFGNIQNLAAISSINSNIAAANVEIGQLQANIAAANIHIDTIDANLGTITSNITTLFGNATSQQANIDAINANVASANLHIADLEANLTSIVGNTIPLGANSSGYLVSNAVALTTTTTVTNGIALLNQVLGKLVPPSPPTFPGVYTITISTLSTYRMCNVTQIDNTTNSRTVAAGATVSNVRRATSYTTSTISTVGPGDAGVITVYKNGVSMGSRSLGIGSDNGTYGHLVITNNIDYGIYNGTAQGFWESCNVYATGSNVTPGWNEVYLNHTLGSSTNTRWWYYDATNPGSPTLTSPTMYNTSNVVIYSSTIPHYTTSAGFTLNVNVAVLSGDMYPTSDTFFTGSGGGAFQAPASKTYATVGITTPLIPNLYVSSGQITVTTTANVTSGFGSSGTGPSVSVDNSYSTASQSFTSATGFTGNTVLYKTGTSSSMEETTITFGSTVGTGSGTAARIINPGSTDTPVYTAGASLFNSQTSTLQVYDTTIVGAVLKHDQTNYSSGYLPVGPNLSSGRSGSQYFTFRFVRTSVSKFNVKFTGTIAGLWVALPGSTIDTTSTLNGWIDMSLAYAGAGVPGAGVGGNGTNGCALGGPVTLNSAVSNHSKTCTFGTVSSSSTATNEIYVRIKLTSGQSVTALSLETASN